MIDEGHTARLLPPDDIRIERMPGVGERWRLRAEQRVETPLRELFPFFADPGNLARITPPELGFEILTPTPIEMSAGSLIDYRIRLWGIPLRWRTAISYWNPPHAFTDDQVAGPYAEWCHHHRFTELADGATSLVDDVIFRLPLGRLGALAAPMVRRQLRRIFRYRQRVIAAGVYLTGAPEPPFDEAARRARHT